MHLLFNFTRRLSLLSLLSWFLITNDLAFPCSRNISDETLQYQNCDKPLVIVVLVDFKQLAQNVLGYVSSLLSNKSHPTWYTMCHNLFKISNLLQIMLSFVNGFVKGSY